MDQDKLSSLALLRMESDITHKLTYEDVIINFTGGKNKNNVNLNLGNF